MAHQKARAHALYTLGLIALLWLLPVTPANATCTPLGSVTSLLGLCKPLAGEVGWTTAINQNWDKLDANVGTIPTGAVMFYGGNSPPNGWYVCDGSAKSRTTDASLFAIYGTTYGAGDGSTTFNLPNASSRTPMFSGTGSFVSSTDFTNVNAGTETITVPANTSLYTGTLITFSTTGVAPGGLTNGNPYYVIKVSSTSIKLAASLAAAQLATEINLTTQGSGTHTFTVAYSTRNLADVGGEELSQEPPAHAHVEQYGSTGGSSLSVVTGSVTTNSGSVAAVTQTQSTGNVLGQNNMPPFITFTCMVKR